MRPLSVRRKTTNRILSNVFLFGLLTLLLSGCQTELKLAKQYMAEHPFIEAAVYFPEKAEVKVEYNIKYEQKTEVLDNFSQDLFLDVMYGAYSDAMKAYDVIVYIPESIDNVQVDSTHWLVMLSQMEITGRITEYEDILFSDTDEISYTHPLNTVNVASWFEVNDGKWKPMLYCEHNLIDGFESQTEYSLWSGSMDYDYIIHTLTVDDVYNYAVYLGKLYAGYTYDYMMNSYVNTELEKRDAMYQGQLRYDPFKKQLRYAAEGDGFIEITGE